MNAGLVFALAGLLGACSVPWALRHDEASGKPPPSACLEVGTATRAAVVKALGWPQREFRADRVAMWRMVEEDGLCVAVTKSRDPEQARAYTLAVEFDDRDVVKRWTLVIHP